jgi:hypothetical protein
MGRRCLAVRWGRAGHEEARADACADLTHLSSTFGPGMGRPDRFCLFASGRWVAIYPFFCLRGRVRTRGGRLHRRDSLTTVKFVCQFEIVSLSAFFIS